MRSYKFIVVYVVKFIMVYGILLASWFVVKDYYAEYFRIASQALFGAFGDEGIVDFQPMTKTDKLDHNSEEFDITVIFLNREIVKRFEKQVLARGYRGTVSIDFETKKSFLVSRGIGHLPTILVVALIVATPFAISRKMSAIFFGLIIVHIYIALKMLIDLLYEFNDRKHLEVVLLNPFWENVLAHIRYIFFLDIGATIIMPVFIWIIVLFRKSDWDLMLEKKSEG